MIQPQTICTVIDNSGAKLARCIGTLKNGRFAVVGDEISVVVSDTRPIGKGAAKVKRGDVMRAIVTRTRKEWQRPDGSWIKFDDNAIVITNKQQQMIGSELTSAIAKEAQCKWPDVFKYAKVI